MSHLDLAHRIVPEAAEPVLTPRTDSLARALGHHAGQPAVDACLRLARDLERELAFLVAELPEESRDA